MIAAARASADADEGSSVDIAGIDPAVVADVEAETSELLSRLIRIDTSNPPGDETRVAEFMDAWFREAGLHGEILGEPADRRSFVLRLEGRRPGPSLLLLAHEDVVPANPDDWQVPPFSGLIEDGYVWGRAPWTSRTSWRRTPSPSGGLRRRARPSRGPWCTRARPTRRRARSAAPAGSSSTAPT